MTFEPGRISRRVALFAVIGTSLVGAGCAKGTYLEVRVTGPGFPDVYGLRMALTLMRPGGAAAQHAIDVIRNDGGKPIRFPATMAFSLDDEEGALRIDATALGTADVPLGSGTAMTTIMHDKTWTVPLALAVGVPPP
jgi:hypothetical protein